MNPSKASGIRTRHATTLARRAWWAAALEEHLAAYADPGPEGLLFPAPEGGFLRLENFRRRVWTPATLAAGVAPLRVHDLRHTWASWHVQNGTSLYELQRLGGWSSYGTVQRYAHLNSQQLQEAAERVSGTKLVHVVKNAGLGD